MNDTIAELPPASVYIIQRRRQSFAVVLITKNADGTLDKQLVDYCDDETEADCYIALSMASDLPERSEYAVEPAPYWTESIRLPTAEEAVRLRRASDPTLTKTRICVGRIDTHYPTEVLDDDTEREIAASLGLIADSEPTP